MDNNSSFTRCFLYDSDTQGEGWGDCCDDLSIVPKPLWIVLLFSLPIEAALAGADVRASSGMYAKKETHTALIFVFYNLATLALLSYEFPWNTCEKSFAGGFECYQGLIFMFYNSTAALASLTIWMLIIMRKFYSYMFEFTRFIIMPDIFWANYEESLEKNIQGDPWNKMIYVKDSWQRVGERTGLYWYNFILISVTLLFGGITHIIPMIFAYFWIIGPLFCGLILSHATRIGFVFRLQEAKKSRPNLKSVLCNVFLFYPFSVIIATLSAGALPVWLFILSPISLLKDWSENLCLGSSSTTFGAAEIGRPRPQMVDQEPMTEMDKRMLLSTSGFIDGAPAKMAVSERPFGLTSTKLSEIRADLKTDVTEIKPLAGKESALEELSGTAAVKQLKDTFWKYMLDALKNLCLYDPDGRLIMFAAATVFVIFTLSANYGLLLYSGATYWEVPLIDWQARKTSLWIGCTQANFKSINAFGLIDFVGLAIGVSAGLLELLMFLVEL